MPVKIFRRCCIVLVWLALCGTALAQTAPAGGPANASADAAQAATEANLANLRNRLAKVPATVETNEDLRQRLSEISRISDEANRFIASRTGQLADLNARLGELGAPPTAPGSTEDADITRQRNALTKQRNALDADVRLAKLLAIDAQQRSGEMLSQRRKMFEAQLTERAPSPLGGEFWNDIRRAWPEDSARLRMLWTELQAGIDAVQKPDHRNVVLLTLLAVLLVMSLGNWLAEHALVRLAIRLLPQGRLRRSLLVIAIVGVNVLLVGVSAQWLHATLDEHGAWGEQTRRVGQAVVASLVFITFVAGLGRALLSVRRPSWRLPPIHDEMARRLAGYPWLVALVGALVWAPAQVNAVVDASFAAVVATHVLTALALTALIGVLVIRLGPTRRLMRAEDASGHEDEDAPPVERPVWVGVLLSSVVVVVVLIWVLVALGYVAMGSFLAGQLTWGGIVASAFYVLFKFADDVFNALVSSKSSFGARLQQSFGFAPQTLDQAAVMLSGLSRVALFFYMLIALVAPLGTGPREVFQRSGRFNAGLQIGEFQVVPSAIFSALAVAVAGFLVLRVVKRWLAQSYLPNTRLEPGMQSSITTLLGYVGAVLVVAFSLSALGIGINRIAWVASALSVGIGFGLQAIVQNFISGLILLAERPVKVGDWVVLGTTEGDVRRINVRATEIQLGDRSTVIVPNSEFITKTVRNMTLANAEGRVLLRLPMPLDTDAKRVRELVLAACRAHAGVLATPEPSVTLEGIEGGTLIFQAIAFVPSPRLAGGVRSDLLFEILDALQAASLPLSVPTMLVAPGAATPMATPHESPPPAPLQS